MADVKQLLFALLAEQNGIVTPESLQLGLAAWAESDYSEPLESMLYEHAQLRPEHARILHGLLDIQMSLHGDAESCLQQIITADHRAIRAEYDRINDGGCELDSTASFVLDATDVVDLPPGFYDNGGIPLQLGPYQIHSDMQELGLGGMGKVYLGTNTKFDQRVAVKLITDQAASRFVDETRTFAQMNHDNVAKIYDAGRVDDDCCYIAMEYVEHAEHLTSYCDENGLSIEKRLRLFLEALDGVRHAHAKQPPILHRDLKPANILVGVYEGVPRVKVIDFGLAGESGIFRGLIAGTPRYMSPEQANGLEQDERTDVYSLGIVLYQLLSGLTPIRPEALRDLDGPARLKRLQSLLRKPALSMWESVESSGRIDDVAAQRGLSPAEFADFIRGDVQALVAKAIDMDPGRRFASVSEFATSVQAFVEAEFDNPIVKAQELAYAELEPLPFASLVSRKRERFYGRDWVIDEIDHWTRDATDERAILITGDAGIGKSSVLAQLAFLRSGQQVIAHHFCQASTPATLDPNRFVLSLAAGLAKHLPAYREALPSPLIQESLGLCRRKHAADRDPASAFEHGIVEALRQIPEPEEGAKFILIDGLDECLAIDGGESILDVLSSRLGRLPDWVRVVATTRPDPHVIKRLADLRQLSIEHNDPRNLADLAGYITSRLRPLVERGAEPEATSTETLAKSLLHKSGGSFLYASTALECVEKGSYRLRDLDQLPPGLFPFFFDRFRKLFSNPADYDAVRPLCEILAAARGPIRACDLADVLKQNLEAVDALLSKLSVFCSRDTTEDGADRYSFYHKAFREWIADEDHDYAVDLAAGNNRLAVWTADRFGEGNEYADEFAFQHSLLQTADEGFDSTTDVLQKKAKQSICAPMIEAVFKLVEDDAFKNRK